MEKEYSNIQMALNIMVSGSMVSNMAMVRSKIIMKDINIWEVGELVRKMAMAKNIGMTVAFMRVIGLIICKMGKVLL